MNKRTGLAIAISSVLTMAVGCSSESVDLEEAAAVGDDGLEPLASISYNGWTANALTPESNYQQSAWRAKATFTGTNTRKAGVCLVQVYENSGGTKTTCSSTADCNNAPTTLPSGGSRYCSGIDGGSTKYCMFRPGSQTEWCAGTPALPKNPPISAGTYYTPYQQILESAPFVSYACFEGCTNSSPSVSSAAVVVSCLNNPMIPC